MSSEANKPDYTSPEIQVENEIDNLCDGFEQAWLKNAEPDIYDYVQQIGSAYRSQLFTELMMLDWDYRSRKGESITTETYLARFPEFEEAIQQAQVDFHHQDTLVLGQQSTLDDAVYPESTIGRFQLQQRIGAGASGEVWRAIDPSLKRVVAIKIPRKKALSDGESLRFQREGKAAAQLQHSGIVAVHEVGREKDLAYIVSDYIEGQDLRRWLAKNRPSNRQAAEICFQLAEALDHAHQRGVIHRDLKPANVILDNLGKPHITDFGLAKWVEDDSKMTLEGDLLGTPAYMSPEQARGDAVNSDGRTDIYSLGILLYEMLTGVCPFTGDYHQIIKSVINDPPKEPREIRKSIPRDLETICLKAIDKNPHKRYPSAQEMAVDIRRFLRGDVIFARRISPLQRLSRWMLKRKAAVTASILLVITILASSGWILVNQQNQELLGIRTVTLSTVPPGAKATFIYLSDETGEPQPQEIVHAQDRTPLAIELRPGSYLAVVVLEDGRFHEVIRRVPRKYQTYPGAYDHNRWKIDEAGTVHLPKIVIPHATVHEGMALVQGGDLAIFDQQSTYSIQGQVRDFYMDPTEVPLSEYRRINMGTDPIDRRWTQVEKDMAVTLNYDQALRMAEKLGKRLPTAVELMTASKTAPDIPVRNFKRANKNISESGLGPVGTPTDDKYVHTHPVFGLRSNVAEWTSSWPTVSVTEESVELPMPFLDSHRIVCCGSEAAFQSKGLEVDGSEDILISIPTRRVSPGLGFRCVRSIQPRTSPEDFGSGILRHKNTLIVSEEEARPENDGPLDTEQVD